MEKQIKKQKRILKGEVLSDKMDKTVVVRISRLKVHSKYRNRYKTSKCFKAHDEKNEYHIGDKVIIEEIRPISKEKRWRVKSKEQIINNKKEDDSTADNIKSN
jgi:small subunit ribosomal protein S17